MSGERTRGISHFLIPVKFWGTGGRNVCVILTVQPKTRAGAYHPNPQSGGGHGVKGPLHGVKGTHMVG